MTLSRRGVATYPTARSLFSRWTAATISMSFELAGGHEAGAFRGGHQPSPGASRHRLRSSIGSRPPLSRIFNAIGVPFCRRVVRISATYLHAEFLTSRFRGESVKRSAALEGGGAADLNEFPAGVTPGGSVEPEATVDDHLGMRPTCRGVLDRAGGTPATRSDEVPRWRRATPARRWPPG